MCQASAAYSILEVHCSRIECAHVVIFSWLGSSWLLTQGVREEPLRLVSGLDDVVETSVPKESEQPLMVSSVLARAIGRQLTCMDSRTKTVLQSPLSPLS